MTLNSFWPLLKVMNLVAVEIVEDDVEFTLHHLLITGEIVMHDFEVDARNLRCRDAGDWRPLPARYRYRFWKL